jgi:hypothetical protein
VTFSGHCLLFGVLPIPFINVILPTFIRPQPHALLEYLLSKQPLASAKLKRENIAEQKVSNGWHKIIAHHQYSLVEVDDMFLLLTE